MERDRVAERLVGLALSNGVDFRRADPSDRDWNLYLTLAVRYLDLKAEKDRQQAIRVASTGRLLDLAQVLVARSPAEGLQRVMSSWQKSYEQLMLAMAGVSKEEAEEIGKQKPVDGIIDVYKAKGGDMNDPVFAEQARIAAEWVEAGNRGG